MNGRYLSSHRCSRLASIAATVSLACAMPNPFLAASGGDCFTVQVAAPVELPDGTVHEAASLTLCRSRFLTPVAALHRVSVNGNPIGLLVSRVGRSEGAAPKAPTVVFRRDGGGALRLVGYASSSGNRAETYLLDAPRRSPRLATRPEALTRAIASAGSSASVLLVAAQVD